VHKSSDVQVHARLDHPVRPIRHHSIHGLRMANETPATYRTPFTGADINRVLRSLDTRYVVEALPMEGVADPRRSHDETWSASSAIRAVKT
jgi:hypothetical protein